MERHCPSCQKLLDDQTAIGDAEAKPDPGDLSICIYCGTFLVFTEDLGIRVMTRDEFTRVPLRAKTQLSKAQHLIRHRHKLN